MIKAKDKSLLQMCIDEFEQKTQIELKLVIEPSAYHYLESILGIIIGFIFLFWGVLHFLDQDFSFIAIYLETILASAVLYLLLNKLQLIQFFISAKQKKQRVQQKALFQFAHHKMYHTKMRSGLLMYYARLERKALMIADVGVLEKISKEDFAKFQQQLENALNHKNFLDETGSFIRSFAIYCHNKWPDETGENEISNEVH